MSEEGGNCCISKADDSQQKVLAARLWEGSQQVEDSAMKIMAEDSTRCNIVLECGTKDGQTGLIR